MQTGIVRLFLAVGSVAFGAGPGSEIEEDLQRGQTLQRAGRFLEAEQQFEAAYRRATQIPLPPKVQAAALSNIAGVEIDLGNRAQAIRSFNRVSELLKKAGEGYEGDIENVRLEIAELYLDEGEVTTAEKLVDGVIAGQQRTRTLAVGDLALAYDLRAGIYGYRKKLQESERTERIGIAVMENAHRQDDPQYAVATLHLAAFLNLLKRPSEALPYAERALAGIRRFPVPEILIEAEARITIASIYSFQGRMLEAHSLAEEACAMVEARYGRDNINTARMLLAEAAVFRTSGDKPAARNAQDRAERILAAAHDMSTSATVPVQALLPGHN